jgi:hypothetical protein
MNPGFGAGAIRREVLWPLGPELASNLLHAIHGMP